MVAFLVSCLMLRFFADLSRRDFINLLVRGVCISYLGFLVTRRIDVRRIGEWLDRHAGLGLGKSLPVALGVIGRSPEAGSAPLPGGDLSRPGPPPC